MSDPTSEPREGRKRGPGGVVSVLMLAAILGTGLVLMVPGLGRSIVNAALDRPTFPALDMELSEGVLSPDARWSLREIGRAYERGEFIGMDQARFVQLCGQAPADGPFGSTRWSYQAPIGVPAWGLTPDYVWLLARFENGVVVEIDYAVE